MCNVCNIQTLSFYCTLSPEDTVVAVSVTGILKVWIVTSEVSRIQVSKRVSESDFFTVYKTFHEA